MAKNVSKWFDLNRLRLQKSAPLFKCLANLGVCVVVGRAILIVLNGKYRFSKFKIRHLN